MFTAGDIILPLRVHTRHFWLLLDLPVPGRKHLAFVVDSGCAASEIRGGVLEELLRLSRATWLGGRRYLLHDLAPSGTSIPNMQVRPGGTVEGIDADGIIGLDYLGGFRRVCVDIPSLELTLTLPV